jgi:hypothetical protein
MFRGGWHVRFAPVVLKKKRARERIKVKWFFVIARNSSQA